MIFRLVAGRRKALLNIFGLSFIFVSLNLEVFSHTVDFRGNIGTLSGGIATVSFYNTYTVNGLAVTDNNISAVDTEAANAAAYTNAALANVSPTAENVTNTTLISNTDGQKGINALRATDTDGSIASFTIVTLPAAAQGKLYINGTAAVAGQVITPTQAGQLSFDPEATFYGTASFSFTAMDNLGAVSERTALYSIPVNAAPVAVDVSSDNIPKDVVRYPIPLLKATDTDGSIVSYTIVSLPTDKGTLWTAQTGGIAITEGQVITTNQLYFNPNGNGNNFPTRSFTYSATDNRGVVSNIASYTIYVNTNPVPSATTIITAPVLNTANATAIASLSATGGTINGYRILASALPTTAQGIIYSGTTRITALPLEAGYHILTTTQAAQLFFDPAVTATGLVTFKYSARNASSNIYSSDVTYTIPIKSVPVANTIATPGVSNAATAPVGVNPLIATDADGTITSFKISSLPASGTLYIGGVAISSGNLSVTYTATNGQLSGLTYLPAAGYTGNTTFTYTATDNEGYVSEAVTYTITVTSPPVVKNIAFELDPIARGFVLISALEATDDGTIASFKIVSLPDPSQGTLYLNSVAVTSGQELTPDEAKLLNFAKATTYLSPATFTYTAKDDMGFYAVNPATYTLQVTNMNPLPVTLINFTAKVQQQAVVLAWATATELGNDYFVVERSADGKVFEALGQVKGAGHSSQKLSYTFHDLSPITGTVYYRLKQVDFDGKSEYSKVAVVQSKEREKALLTLYPNPATDVLNLDLATLDKASYTVRVLSKDGRVLQLQTLTGGSVQKVDVSGLGSGVYVLQVHGPQQPRTFSFIKL